MKAEGREIGSRDSDIRVTNLKPLLEILQRANPAQLRWHDPGVSILPTVVPDSCETLSLGGVGASDSDASRFDHNSVLFYIRTRRAKLATTPRRAS